MLSLPRIFIISALLFAGCQGRSKNKIDSQNKIDKPLSQIQMFDLDNKAVRLDEYIGKTVFINFWATWCKPCVVEMPSIEKAQTIMNSEQVVFLLASSESIEEIKEFNSNHPYKFNYVHLENSEKLNLQALPTTFIINPKGNLVFAEMGSRNWDEATNINLIKNITQQHD